MKKVLFISLLFLAFQGVLFSQETAPADKKEVKLEKMDILLLDFNASQWFGQADSIKTLWHSRGFSMGLLYEVGMGKSNFKFAIGGGLSNQNIFLKNSIAYSGDTATYLSPFPESYVYKRSKLSTTYWEIPAEIRFRTKPDKRGYCINVAVGARYGRLFNVHTKTVVKKGEKYKSYIYPTANKERYGATLRVGYGRVGLNAYYGLTPVFGKNKGPAFNHVSLGITISPF